MREANALRQPVIIEPEIHKVTPEMLQNAEARETLKAPEFRFAASDGRTYQLSEERADGPVVLIFIKDGCPCSVSAETHFNDLHAAYEGHVRFFGVFDGSLEKARGWASRNAVPFPILLDPEGNLVRLYQARNSAYVVLIDRSGTIDAFWPGYSSAMLQVVNARIAKLAGLPEAAINTSEAPDELYSGCPFEIETEAPPVKTSSP